MLMISKFNLSDKVYCLKHPHIKGQVIDIQRQENGFVITVLVRGENFCYAEHELDFLKEELESAQPVKVDYIKWFNALNRTDLAETFPKLNSSQLRMKAMSKVRAFLKEQLEFKTASQLYLETINDIQQP